MKIITVDVESYYDSNYSLRKMSPVEYILDHRWETIGWAVKEGDAPSRWMEDGEFRSYLQGLPDEVAMISHNALFDMCVLAWRYDYNPKLMIDTLGMARAWMGHQLRSLALSSVANELGIGQKGTTIHKVAGMNLAAIRAAGFYDEYADYSKNDADLCHQIFCRFMGAGFPAAELAVMDSVIRCATRPEFLIDSNLLAEHVAEIRAHKESLIERVGGFIGGLDSFGTNAGKAEGVRRHLMSNDRFAEALRSLGVEPPMKTSPVTGKQTYAFAKTDQEFIDLEEHEDPDVQALVAARLGVKSTIEETRSQRLLNISRLSWPGNRQRLMPMPLRYSGAHTHRLSGDWSLNVQNLGRGSKLRYALTAPKGKLVIAADESQIEARMAGWFCGAQELTDAFRNKEDVYSTFASKVFGYPVAKATHKVERFIGKTCLSGESLVVTDQGFVPIEQVTTAHRLWDGEEWVCHSGVVSNGLKKTSQLCGLWLTADHDVLCGEEWLPAQSLLDDESILSQALATAAEKLPSQVTSKTLEGLSQHSSSSATAAVRNILSIPITSKTSSRVCLVYDIADAGPRNRFMVLTERGPLIVHNCILGLQYGLGWVKFQATTAMQSKAQVGQEVLLSDEEALRAVHTYRRTYHQIPATWRQLDALIPQMTHKDCRVEWGPLVFMHEKIQLPSGLFLHYHDLQNRDGQWTFSYSGKPKYLYGGKLLENIVQALSRIVVMDVATRMRKLLESMGRPDIELKLQVHDELVYIAPEADAQWLLDVLIEEMRKPPEWAPTVPLDAEGTFSDSYGGCK